MGKPTFNIYQHVTEAILAELKAGTVPWRQCWGGDGAGCCGSDVRKGGEVPARDAVMPGLRGAA